MNRRIALPTMGIWLMPVAAEAHNAAGAIDWTFDPCVVTPLLLAAVAYAAGVSTVWRHAGFGRGARPWQTLCYAAGWLALAGALVSPLHAMGERLFSAHMVEHEIVMAVAAPLLVLARPASLFLWAWPSAWRPAIGGITRAPAWRVGWGAATSPAIATAMHGIAIWLWHVPMLFDLSITHVGVHRLQHLSFLLTALLFWWALLRNCGAGAAAWHLFATMTHSGLLGALLVFAPRVLYGAQTLHAPDWGLTPLEDQQLAGLIMWVPVGTIYAAAALLFTAQWIARSGTAWEPGDATHLR